MTLLAPNPTDSARDRWEILPLDERSWRVCDSSFDASDPSRLIAYVEQTPRGTVDVLWLSNSAPTQTEFSSLDDALTAWNQFLQ